MGLLVIDENCYVPAQVTNRKMNPPEEAEYQISPAKPSHVLALLEFIHPFVTDRILLPRTEDELDDLIATGFVAERDGQIVGFCSLEVYSPKLGEIRSLAVDPSLQGKGIGKQLVERCIELAKSKGIREVMAITSTEQFFQSCGFNFTLPDEKKALFYPTSGERG